MRKKIIFTSIFILSLFFANSVFSQGYKIKVQIKGVENQELILGYHKNSNLIPLDTVNADKKGVATFSGKEPLVGGLYFVFLPSRQYFDFLVGDDQNFEIQNDTSNIYYGATYKGCKDNQLLKEYHTFLSNLNKKMTAFQEEKKNAKSDDEKKKVQEKIDATNKEYVGFYNKMVTENEGTFFATFIKATREVEVPAEITDQKARYMYYRHHYFDNFDVGNPRLLNTPFYEKKIETYFDKVLLQDPDTLIAEADILLAKTKHDEELYKYVLIHLFNKYASNQYMFAENIYVHLAEVYQKEATWSTDSFRNSLGPKIERKKNCLIGNTAKNMVMQTLPNDSSQIDMLRIFLEDMKERGLEIEQDETRTFDEKLPELSELIAEFISHMNGYKSLEDIDSKYTILWFFEPECSHCKKQTPQLFKAYNDELIANGHDVTVFCIYLERNTDDWNKFSNSYSKWFDFVQKNKMYGETWYNLSNPFEKHRYNYDISSTPVLYLLDKDKKILAKRIGHEQAVEIIKKLDEKDK